MCNFSITFIQSQWVKWKRLCWNLCFLILWGLCFVLKWFVLFPWQLESCNALHHGDKWTNVITKDAESWCQGLFMWNISRLITNTVKTVSSDALGSLKPWLDVFSGISKFDIIQFGHQWSLGLLVWMWLNTKSYTYSFYKRLKAVGLWRSLPLIILY